MKVILGSAEDENRTREEIVFYYFSPRWNDLTLSAISGEIKSWKILKVSSQDLYKE